MINLMHAKKLSAAEFTKDFLFSLFMTVLNEFEFCKKKSSEA